MFQTGDQRKVLIVGNPYGGWGVVRQKVEGLALVLRGFGIDSRVVWDKAERDGLVSAAELASWCRCVVVAGGDGTVADVLNLVPGVPVAAIPMGNENLFAREMGFTVGGADLAEAIARGRERVMDLGEANGRRFSLVVSAGFDAEVAKRVAVRRAGKGGGHVRKVGRWDYAWPIVGALAGYGYPMLSVEADGKVIRGALAMVFNLPRYGLGLPLCPRASAEDGLLDYVVLTRPGRVALMRYAALIRMNRHGGCADVVCGRAKAVVLRGEGEAPVEIDGDAAGQTPVEVRCLPGALRVVRM